MKGLRIILFTLVLTISFTVTSQQKLSTYFVSIPQVGSDASFLVLETNINNGNIQALNKTVNNYFNTLSINQIGVNNVAELKKGGLDKQFVTQSGKNNYYSFIDYYNNAPTKMDILQQGNANSLQVFGSNSLMENVKIIQKSNNKSIVVRNY